MLLYCRLDRGATSVLLTIYCTMFHTCKVDQVRSGQPRASRALGTAPSAKDRQTMALAAPAPISRHILYSSGESSRERDSTELNRSPRALDRQRLASGRGHGRAASNVQCQFCRSARPKSVPQNLTGMYCNHVRRHWERWSSG